MRLVGNKERISMKEPLVEEGEMSLIAAGTLPGVHH